MRKNCNSNRGLIACMLLLNFSIQNCNSLSNTPVSRTTANPAFVKLESVNQVDMPRLAGQDLVTKREAADIDINAQYEIGVKYYLGHNVEQDYQKAFEWLEKAANNEHIKAQCILGIIHMHGQYVSQDYQKATEWFKKAAGQGDQDAQRWLCLINFQNKRKRTKQKYEEVAELHNHKIKPVRQSASQKKDVAVKLYKLGINYLYGIGIEKDYQKAFEYLTQSAQQGNAKAQYELGLLYLVGKNIEKNYQKAFEYFLKSAQRGNTKAQYTLGLMYYKGEGVKQDYQKAIEWLEKAANRGNTNAQNQLGLVMRLTTLNADSPINLWEEYFKDLGATECWQEVQTQKVNLTFNLRKLEKIDLSVEQPSNVLAGILQYIRCYKSPVKILSIQKGDIRTIDLSQLTSLQGLDLTYNMLRELPVCMSQLTQLKTLNLSNNKIKTFPSALGALNTLEKLTLAWNLLQTLPPCIERLTNLQELDLSYNQLTSLPSHMNQLTCLKKLNLTNNKLQALPISIFQLYDSNNLSIKLTKNPLFKTNELYPLIEQTLGSYAYSQLPLSLRSLCASAVLKYAEESKVSYVVSNTPREGTLQKTWRGVGKFFRCSSPNQSTKPIFTRKDLQEVLPSELWLENLPMLIEQEYEAKNPEIPKKVVCFKNMNSQKVPCYLPSLVLCTSTNVKMMLQQVKENNLTYYLVINEVGQEMP